MVRGAKRAGLEPQTGAVGFAEESMGPEHQDQQNNRVGDQVPQGGGEDHGRIVVARLAYTLHKMQSAFMLSQSYHW